MKHFLGVLFCALSFQSYAYTECSRPVQNIWNDLSDGKSVWVSFSDSGSPIYKNESQLSEGQMNRLVSFALAAQASNKKLRLRYPEDGLECPPKGPARGDALGIWILSN